jgi:Xaa-Pro aminopeptidase
MDEFRDTSGTVPTHRKGPILEPKGYRGLTLEEAARKTPPTNLTDTEAMIDMAKLRVDRQARLREALRAHDVAACLLITPHSLRYASGLRNCAIYQTHIPATYFFLPAEGASVLFDSQPGRFTGQEWAAVWAAQMAALMARSGGGNRRLAIERLSPRATRALEAQGLEVLDAEDIIEPARAIK